MIVNIEECERQIPPTLDIVAFTEMFSHLQKEVMEVGEAFEKLPIEKTDVNFAKNLAHVGEELGDVMTMAWTILTALQQYGRDIVSSDFAEDCLELVATKNRCRGYYRRYN